MRWRGYCGCAKREPRQRAGEKADLGAGGNWLLFGLGGNLGKNPLQDPEGAALLSRHHIGSKGKVQEITRFYSEPMPGSTANASPGGDAVAD
jgi:hypothetical protein